MLNQTSTEAMLSAAYVENYLDCVENLPNDLQRHLSRMRELDVTYRECIRDVETQLAVCIGSNVDERRRNRATIRLQSALVAAQEIGDEKLQVVQILQDIINNKQQSLDTDHKKFLACMDINTSGPVKESSPPAEPAATRDREPSTPHIPQPDTPTPTPERTQDKEKEKGEKEKTGERWSKRARRSRTTTATGASGTTDGADSSERDSERPQHANVSKRGMGKKKKRRARGSGAGRGGERGAEEGGTGGAGDVEPAEDIDPDEPRYCLCDQISFGEMILCDNDLCPIEWFHFSCVALATKPKGKWFCPKCRGDRPNQMKPKSMFLKELERYNREKEEKALQQH